MADWWHNRPWRMIQTNLREIDMRDIRADRVVADLQSFKANGLMINAAGIIAGYPTDLPFHFQSPHLTGDSLNDIISACHDADIRVVARTDFSKIRRPIYEAHPEWAYVTSDGRIVDYNGDVHACINGGYQQDYALKIIEELLARCDFDGIFFNMGGYQTRDYSGNVYGICHCDSCRRAFGGMFDLSLPEKEDRRDPTYRKYLEFKSRTLRAHHEKVYNHIHSLRPDICIANHREYRRGFNRQESNTGVDRALPHWQYSGSDNTKWAVSSYPEMVSSNTTVDFIDIPYRHVAVSPHQQALRLAQNLANGGALDFYLIGRLDNHRDRSGFQAVKDVYHYHAANEDTYLDIRSKAAIALLRGEARDNAEYRGWFRFLTENHFPFDTLVVDAALDLPWDRYEAIVLPDLQQIGDTLAKRLDRFVKDGGALISVFQSGFRDEANELREQPVLKSPGIERIEHVRADMRPSYFQIDDKQTFSRFADTDLIYMDGPYVYARYADAAEKHLKLIPPHPFGPPERCYYTEVTDHPGFTVHPYGKGRAITIPWKPGSLFHRQGHLNTADFAANLLEGIAGLRPIRGNFSPMVEATLFEKQDGSYQLLHLVNGSGHFGTSFYAPVAMADLEVEIACPRQPESVRGLACRRPLDFEWADGTLTVHVPRLGLFETIRIE